MKKLLRFFLFLLVFVLFLGAVVYIFLAHPNDSRLAMEGMAAKDMAGWRAPTQFWTKASSVFADSLPHSLDIDRVQFAHLRDELFQNVLPESAQAQSSRFTSPYQVYVPVGKYPHRLQGMDAIFIPPGSKLTIHPQLSGRFQVRFSAIGVRQAAAMKVEHAGNRLAELTVEAAFPEVVEPKGWWPDFYAKYLEKNWEKASAILKVDHRKELPHWQSLQAELMLQANESLSVDCPQQPSGCLLSDVVFLRAAAQAPQNTLLILVDTMRGDALYGGQAKHLEELSGEATVFRHAIAPGNMTSPSTNGILSCQRPSDIGPVAFAYAVDSRQRRAFYQAQKPSFPAIFAQAGYKTAMIGNISVISEIYGVGVHHGFEEQVSIEADAYDTPQIAAEAVRWLQQNADRGFFLYLHLNGPHAPYRAPWQDIRATFPGRAAFRSYPDILKWLYQSEIHYTDRYLEVIFTAMKRLGLWERTNIVLTADHGDQHTQRLFPQNAVGRDFTGAYFDHGATMLDDEINVPLIVKPAGQVNARVEESFQTTLSLGPTLLELSNLPVPAYCRAPSLKAGLLSSAVMQSPAVFGSEGFRARAVYLDGRYKYVRAYEPTDKKVYNTGNYTGTRRLYLVPEELYDLSVDGNETNNLVKQRGDLRAHARQAYRRFYGIESAYELIAEVPESAAYQVSFAAGAEVVVEDDLDDASGRNTTQLVDLAASGQGPARLSFLIRRFGATLPQVRINNIPLKLRVTSLRLPVDARLESLPEEAGGTFTLLPKTKEARAYLRRIVDDGQQNRRIVTGNAQFEKVLREWGYLNE